MGRIYFDYAASTPVDPLVLKEMLPYFGKKYGNPGSLHRFGQEGMAAIDRAREIIAQSIGADFREIIFTGSATEANNLALRGILKGFRFKVLGFSNKNQKYILTPNTQNLTPRIIISTIEHESILETAKDLEKEGVEVVVIPVNKNGIIDLQKLKSALNDRTILVSVMHANNEIGTVQPIAEISKIVRDFRNKTHNSRLITHNSEAALPLLHTDAAQAFQYLNCDIKKLGVDLMTLSAQKIYGPKGVGALYARTIDNRQLIIDRRINGQMSNVKSQLLSPLVTGGGQEFGLRSGTENVPAIVGFAKAAELAAKNRKKVFKRVSELRNYFWKELKKIYPKAVINGMGVRDVLLEHVPHILNVSFPNHKSQDLLIKLDMAGIAVSSGAACSARSSKLSHVLKAIDLPIARIQGSLRFSFGKYTTKQELKKAIKTMNQILK